MSHQDRGRAPRRPSGEDPRASVIRCAGIPEVPWRNGGGRTRELHAGAGWRLSVATISSAGAFSAFPGLDRTLVVGRGQLSLAIGTERQRRLAVGDRIEFPGDAPVEAEPIGGPVIAVNLMAEPARCTAAVRVVQLDGAAPAAEAIVLLGGTAAVDGEELGLFDAVLNAEGGAVRGSRALAVMVSVAETPRVGTRAVPGTTST